MAPPMPCFIPPALHSLHWLLQFNSAKVSFGKVCRWHRPKVSGFILYGVSWFPFSGFHHIVWEILFSRLSLKQWDDSNLPKQAETAGRGSHHNYPGGASRCSGGIHISCEDFFYSFLRFSSNTVEILRKCRDNICLKNLWLSMLT